MVILLISLVYIYLFEANRFVLLLLMCALLLITKQCFKIWRHRTKSKYYEKQIDLPIVLNENYLQFPDGYYFKFGTPDNREKIFANRINAFLPNIFPLAFIIDNKEIVFLGKLTESEISPFCLNNNIPKLVMEDIWERINRPYLDTEFDEEEKIANDMVLFKNGIESTELSSIRKKVKMTMIKNYYAWAWVYLGQYDYLSWTILTNKKYWWTMDIALRGLNSVQIKTPPPKHSL